MNLHLTMRILAALWLVFSANLCAGDQPPDPTKVPPKTAGFGLQAWRTSPKFPEDWVKERWNDGYHITTVSHGGGLWAVVMSKESGYGLQYWKTSQSFPAEHVKKEWAAGKSITSVAYGGGLWAVITSKGVAYGSQTYSMSAHFPEAFVKQYWDDGHHITSMAYGHGHWAVVMSTDSGFSLQSWKTSVQYPDEWIKEHWDKGYDITSMAHGGGLWGVVMSKQLRDDSNKKGFLGVAVVDAKDGEKGALVTDTVADSPAAKAGIQKNDVIVAIDGATTGNSTQMLDRVKTFPAGQPIEIRVFREGKTKDIRVVLGGRTLTIERHYGSQHWQTRQQFPRDFVQDRWDDGHFITSVAFGQGLWAVVMSKEDLPPPRELPKLPSAFFDDREP